MCKEILSLNCGDVSYLTHTCECLELPMPIPWSVSREVTVLLEASIMCIELGKIVWLHGDACIRADTRINNGPSCSKMFFYKWSSQTTKSTYSTYRESSTMFVGENEANLVSSNVDATFQLMIYLRQLKTFNYMNMKLEISSTFSH